MVQGRTGGLYCSSLGRLLRILRNGKISERLHYPPTRFTIAVGLCATLISR